MQLQLHQLTDELVIAHSIYTLQYAVNQSLKSHCMCEGCEGEEGHGIMH